MAQSIKISDEIMKALRVESELATRSLAGQAEHWLRIGRAVENSSNFSYQHIKEALSGLKSPDELMLEEQELYFEELEELMWKAPTEEEQAKFKHYLGNNRTLVGLDENDNLVFENQ
jgi:hypothetical protein